jgi:hypothetical protein
MDGWTNNYYHGWKLENPLKTEMTDRKCAILEHGSRGCKILWFGPRGSQALRASEWTNICMHPRTPSLYPFGGHITWIGNNKWDTTLILYLFVSCLLMAQSQSFNFFFGKIISVLYK